MRFLILALRKENFPQFFLFLQHKKTAQKLNIEVVTRHVKLFNFIYVDCQWKLIDTECNVIFRPQEWKIMIRVTCLCNGNWILFTLIWYLIVCHNLKIWHFAILLHLGIIFTRLERIFWSTVTIVLQFRTKWKCDGLGKLFLQLL